MKKIIKKVILFQLLLSLKFTFVTSHARLMEPESRATRWRFNHSAPVNYNDNQGYCGGYTNQWIKNKGKCGICGDPFNSTVPRLHELGGKYGEGIIVKKYIDVKEMNVSVFITANHKGYFKFDLCNLDINKKEEEKCFVRLDIIEKGKRIKVAPSVYGWYNTTVLIPNETTCEHCVFRWRYIAGNNWGYCRNGKGKTGCGPQEEFRACSDILIVT